MDVDENQTARVGSRSPDHDDYDKRDHSSPVRRNRSRSRSPSPPRRDRSFSRERRGSGGQRRRDVPEDPEPSNVLGVFGLSMRTQESDLDHLFSKYGPVEKVIIVYDSYTKKSRGFGFITFRDVESATDARNAMNGVEIDERRIRVDFSVTRKPHDPTPGQYMGKLTQRQREERFGRRRGFGRRSRSRSRGRYERRRHRSRSYSPRRRSRSRSRDHRRKPRSPSYERRRYSRSRSR